MREYSNKISLTKNSRGIYSLDTSIGCKSGLENEDKGCFNDMVETKNKAFNVDLNKVIEELDNG